MKIQKKRGQPDTLYLIQLQQLFLFVLEKKKAVLIHLLIDLKKLQKDTVAGSVHQ